MTGGVKGMGWTACSGNDDYESRAVLLVPRQEEVQAAALPLSCAWRSVCGCECGDVSVRARVQGIVGM